MEISQDDFMLFVDRALDGMLGIVEGLGDDLANRNPGLPGANSPFAILYHSVAVCHYWIAISSGTGPPSLWLRAKWPIFESQCLI